MIERIVLGGKDGIKARDSLVKGLDYSVDIVKSTLGPGGRNIFLEKKNRVTNDGVSIAQEIFLDDEVENLGAQKVKEITAKINDEVGDGTTSGATLAQAILKASLPKLRQEGAIAGGTPPMKLVEQLTDELNEAVALLNGMATPIESEEQMIEVAKVSVENEELAQLIGKAQWELGPDGHIMVEEWTKDHTVLEHTPGIRIDNGYASSLLVNNPEKGILELTDTPVILTNHTVQTMSTLEGVLNQLVQAGYTRAIIVARGFTEEAVATCMKNSNTPNGFKMFPINAPFTDQVQVMYDMEAALGGKFINNEERPLGSINMSDVGHASKVLCDRFSSTFVGANNREEEREARAQVLEKKLESELSDFERRDIGRRISQLRKGISILKVGGISETDRRYKKDKADDAVNAVRHALKEGIVPGAGQALKDIADKMDDDAILKQALPAVYNQIQTNAGKFEVPEWVKDPVKVVRVSLEKACSVAAVFATAEGVIVTKKQRYNAFINNGQGGE